MATTAKKITTASVLKGVSPSSKALPVISNDINPVIDDLEDIDSRLSDIDGYKVYTALLTQSGANAPIATVLKNTLGATLTYTYDSVGFYIVTSSINLFTSPNEHVVINGSYATATDLIMLQAVPVFFNAAVISSIQNGVSANSVMGTESGQAPCVFEIKIYA